MSSSSSSAAGGDVDDALARPRATYGSSGGSAAKKRRSVFGSPLLPDKRPKLLLSSEDGFDALLFEDDDGGAAPAGRDAFIQSVSVHREDRRVKAACLTAEDVLDDDAVVVTHDDDDDERKTKPDRFVTPPRARRTYQTSAKRKKGKKPVSEIREQRVRNLGKRSNSQLLLDVLVRRPSGQARELERAVLGRVGWTGRKAFEDVMAQGLGAVGEATEDLLALVRHLLAHGADPNHSDADGRFPLLVAVQYVECSELVRMLLNEHAHADEWVQRPGRRSLSLVDVALRLGHEGAVRQLLAKGACVTAARPVPVGESVLSFARLHGFEKLAAEALAKRFWRAVVKRPHDMSVVRSLIFHGMPADIPAKNGMTPLFFLVKDTAHARENLPLVEFLLAHGANPAHRDNQNVSMAVYPRQSVVKDAKLVLGAIERVSSLQRAE